MPTFSRLVRLPLVRDIPADLSSLQPIASDLRSFFLEDPDTSSELTPAQQSAFTTILQVFLGFAWVHLPSLEVLAFDYDNEEVCINVATDVYHRMERMGNHRMSNPPSLAVIPGQYIFKGSVISLAKSLRDPIPTIKQLSGEQIELLRKERKPALSSWPILKGRGRVTAAGWRSEEAEKQAAVITNKAFETETEKKKEVKRARKHVKGEGWSVIALFDWGMIHPLLTRTLVLNLHFHSVAISKLMKKQRLTPADLRVRYGLGVPGKVYRWEADLASVYYHWKLFGLNYESDEKDIRVILDSHPITRKISIGSQLYGFLDTMARSKIPVSTHHIEQLVELQNGEYFDVSFSDYQKFRV